MLAASENPFRPIDLKKFYLASYAPDAEFPRNVEESDKAVSISHLRRVASMNFVERTANAVIELFLNKAHAA